MSLIIHQFFGEMSLSRMLRGLECGWVDETWGHYHSYLQMFKRTEAAGIFWKVVVGFRRNSIDHWWLGAKCNILRT